ncbi:MAG: Hsp20/alpha crystallin family protein [Patescibacteria group bacterium]
MALIPYEPFKDIENFFNDDDDWFLPVTKRETVPEMDVYETEDSIVAEISAPGMESENLDVSIEEGALRVRGDKSEEIEDEEKGYYRKEIRRGSFERVVRLPSNIDEENVQASYEDGILKIEIPKTDEVEKGRKIEIETK